MQANIVPFFSFISRLVFRFNATRASYLAYAHRGEKEEVIVLTAFEAISATKINLDADF